MVKQKLNEPKIGSKKQQPDDIQQVRAVQNAQSQNSLTKFFGAAPMKKRGQAEFLQFPSEFTIYSWNVNGISATI